MNANKFAVYLLVTVKRYTKSIFKKITDVRKLGTFVTLKILLLHQQRLNVDSAMEKNIKHFNLFCTTRFIQRFVWMTCYI